MNNVGTAEDIDDGMLEGASVDGSIVGKANGEDDGDDDGAIEYSQLQAAVSVSGDVIHFPLIEYTITV